MAVSDQFFFGGYKGVPFLVRSEGEDGGKKVAVHEYPGTSKRFVEELGRLPPRFRIQAIVHGPDVLNERRRLTQAVSSPGAGVLSHWQLGEIDDVVCVSHSIDTSQTEIGQVVFNLEFMTSDGRQSLEPIVGDVQAVFQAAETARETTTAAATDRLKPVSILDSARQIADRVTEQVDAVQEQISSVVNPPTDALNEVTRRINDFRGDMLSIVRTPGQLMVATRGVFDSMLGLANTPADLRREWRNLTNFGAPQRFQANGQLSRTIGTVRSKIARTTAKRILEDDNLRVIEQNMRIEALINSLEAEAAATFLTDDEILATRLQLADDYDRIIERQDDVLATSSIGDEILTDANVTIDGSIVSEAKAFRDSLAFDPDVRRALEDLKVATFDVLAADVKNTYRVASVDLGVTDITLATFQIYGSLDLVETIAGLNRLQNHAYVRSALKTVLE